VAVRDESDVAPVEERPGAVEHRIHAPTDLFDRLARMTGVTGDDSVVPQVPTRAILAYLRGRSSLVPAVVPLPQVRVALQVVEPDQLGGTPRPDRRTGESL
jgi:hypothetical protein